MGFTNFLKNLFTPDFLRRLGGAGLSALAHGGLEALYNSDPATWTEKFPFIGTIDPLPPLDAWLVWGGSVGTWGLAAWKRKMKIKQVGEGMTLYATGMILHAIIIRAGRMVTTAPAPAAAAPTPAQPVKASMPGRVGTYT